MRDKTYWESKYRVCARDEVQDRRWLATCYPRMLRSGSAELPALNAESGCPASHEVTVLGISTVYAPKGRRTVWEEYRLSLYGLLRPARPYSRPQHAYSNSPDGGVYILATAQQSCLHPEILPCSAFLFSPSCIAKCSGPTSDAASTHQLMRSRIRGLAGELYAMPLSPMTVNTNHRFRHPSVWEDLVHAILDALISMKRRSERRAARARL